MTIRKKILLILGTSLVVLIALLAAFIRVFPIERLTPYTLIPLIILIIVFGLLAALLIERLVVSRVGLLSDRVTNINPATFTGKLTIDGNDELSILAEGVNKIMVTLGDSQEKLREREEQYRRLFNQDLSANYVARADGEILLCNPNFVRLFGFGSLKETIGTNLFSLFPGNEAREKHLQFLLREKKLEAQEMEFRKKDGGRLEVVANVFGNFNEQGDLLQIQGHLFDISDHKQAQSNLQRLTDRDQLTGLYNRTYFEREMHRLESGEFDPVGILISDIDGLKFINETMGNAVGDQVLLSAVEIVKKAFRESDLIARIGGDEFAVLIPFCDRTLMEEAYQKIRKGVQEYNEENPLIPLSISMGIAVNSDSGTGVQELLKEADNTMVREKTLSSQSIHSSVVATLKKALEVRDFITQGHAIRVQELCEKMARTLRLPERTIMDLRLMAQFHDIGKVGIPDRILMKPGSLSPEEAMDMQRHCEIGYRVALAATDLVPIADWILKHHEWWNGEGYPMGLKGDKIPLECRILAIADAFDVITNNRPYRKAAPREQALKEIQDYAGIQFDPYLVRIFTELVEKGEIK